MAKKRENKFYFVKVHLFQNYTKFCADRYLVDLTMFWPVDASPLRLGQNWLFRTGLHIIIKRKLGKYFHSRLTD